jgi:phenylacetate-CoA ligase
MPLKINFGEKEYDNLIAKLLFVWFEQGMRLKDTLITIQHKPFQTDSNYLFSKLAILNWNNISIFSPIQDIIRALDSSKPDIVFTYPSILTLLSEEIDKINFTKIEPRLIFTIGETLTEYNRKKCSTVFNSDVYTMYGTEENGLLAFECKEHSGYHCISDCVIIELLNDDRNVENGEVGEIVVTNLINYTMPLIRYKIGDIGTFTDERCSCGRSYPLITSIEGRTDDFLILPSGKKISPRVINVIEDIPGVYRYKTVQETKNRIVVNLVKGKGFNDKTISEIKKHIKAGCLGEDVKVDVKLVEELPLEGRGKLRAVVSNVKELQK